MEKDLVGLLTLRWDLLKDDNGIDDYLYVLTFHKTQGTIFRIVSKATNATTTDWSELEIV